jgi:hypothetical protein
MITLKLHSDRNRSNSHTLKMKETTMSAIRITLVLIALLAFFMNTGHAAAAQTIPSNYRPLGPVQTWSSKTVEHNRPGPQSNSFQLPSATQYISVTIVWRGTNNDGAGNENGIVETSAPAPYNSIACSDQGHGDHVCATFAVSYTTSTFDVNARYNLDLPVDTKHGDSHKYRVFVQPFGPTTGDDTPNDDTPSDNPNIPTTPDQPGLRTPGTPDQPGQPGTPDSPPNNLIPPGWTPPTGNESGDAPSLLAMNATMGQFASYAQAFQAMLVAFGFTSLVLILALATAHFSRYSEHMKAKFASLFAR